MPNAEAHDYAAAGRARRLTPSATDADRRPPRSAGRRDLPGLRRRARRPQPDRCDDTAYGKGAGGRLTVRRPGARRRAHGLVLRRRLRPRRRRGRSRAEPRPCATRPPCSAPSSRPSGPPSAAHPGHPARRPAAPAQRRRGASRTSPSPCRRPATCRSGSPTPARTTPRPVGTVAKARWIGAGWPDYPWLFATDGEYTGFAAVASGQFAAIKDHLRALRDVSVAANGTSGKVVHEVTPDGQVYFGANERRGQHRRDREVPEPGRAGVALDRRRPVPRRDVPLRGAATCATSSASSTPTRTAGPRASATSSAAAWARRSSTTPSTRSAGCATSPTSRPARATPPPGGWATSKAAGLETRFDKTWWFGSVRPAVRRLARRPGQQARSSSGTGSG